MLLLQGKGTPGVELPLEEGKPSSSGSQDNRGDYNRDIRVRKQLTLEKVSFLGRTYEVNVLSINLS